MRKNTRLAWVGIGLIAVLAAVLSVGCPPRTATVRVWNTTDKTIVEFYCTPTTDPFWGDNLISSNIAPGEQRDVRGFTPGDYDMLAVFADDSEADRFDVTLDAGEVFTWNVLLSLPSGK